MEKVVLRYKDGNVKKGFIKNFSEDSKEVVITEADTGNEILVELDLLKAIFFVKTFEGDPSYREIKRYKAKDKRAKRVYVRFKDKESLLGYTEDDIPWRKGFFLSKNPDDRKGFFIIPTDEGSNNLKIFVVASAVEDLTII